MQHILADQCNVREYSVGRLRAPNEATRPRTGQLVVLHRFDARLEGLMVAVGSAGSGGGRRPAGRSPPRDASRRAHRIGRAITLLRQRGDMAILLVEQYLDFAHELADDFAAMDPGEIVMSGTRETFDAEAVRRHMTV